MAQESFNLQTQFHSSLFYWCEWRIWRKYFGIRRVSWDIFIGFRRSYIRIGKWIIKTSIQVQGAWNIVWRSKLVPTCWFGEGTFRLVKRVRHNGATWANCADVISTIFQVFSVWGLLMYSIITTPLLRQFIFIVVFTLSIYILCQPPPLHPLILK